LKVLIVNDDGPDSPALEPLVLALRDQFEVSISVPSSQRSGTGHGFTFLSPIFVSRTELFDVPAILVGGLPSDAVKYAVCTGFARPDVVLAGINPGENAGVCAPYSGTVACAREAALWGLPAIALSSLGLDLEHYSAIASWAARLLRSGLPPTPPGIFWNVNFPSHPPARWGDVRICPGSNAMFRDRYLDRGDGYWQLEGSKDPERVDPGSDDDWLRRGHPAMVPQRADATEHDLLDRLDWVPPSSIQTGAQ